MELEIIELVAYQTNHIIDQEPWRCVTCEHLTHHEDENILDHLVMAHNLNRDTLKIHHDQIFIHPRKEPLDGNIH
jgi:hypothetical protein